MPRQRARLQAAANKTLFLPVSEKEHKRVRDILALFYA
jgi:hypothetical protein